MKNVTQFLRCLFISSFFLLWAVAAHAATPTTITVSVSPNSVQVGAQMTATITVAGDNPTGQVCMSNGVSGLGCQTLVNGQATINWSASSTPGTYTFVASYNGDAVNDSSSGSMSYTVASAGAATVTVTGNATQVTAGQTVTLTATVGGNNPTGTVSFSDSFQGTTTVIGTVGLTNGQAILTQTFNTKGSHSIWVNYSGDANNAPATSSIINLNVVKLATTTAVSISPNPVQAGSQTTAAITVAGSSPTGQVCMSNGIAGLGCQTLVNGQATINWSASSTPGTYTFVSSYGGDTINDISSASMNYTVASAAPAPAPATATVTGDVAQVTAGQAVTLTANVSGASPTGTVSFKDGTTVIGAVTLTNGQAVLTQPFNNVGTHNITVDYSGDANNAAATSSAFSVSVEAATTTTVSISPNSVQTGALITATITVAGSSPTGQVCLSNGITGLGCQTLANGQATISWNASSTPGTYTFVASYGGDTANAASSGSMNYTVTSPAPATVTLTGNVTQIMVGETVTLTATVSAGKGGNKITGTISFKDGSTVIGTVALSGYGYQAALTQTFNVGGSHQITADYSGDTNNGSGTSSVFTVNVVVPATTTTLSVSPNPVRMGAALAATITVAGSNPTGQVCIESLGCATLVSGQATINTSAASSVLGVQTLTATYNGDGINPGSTSSPVSYTVSGVTLNGSASQVTTSQAVTLTANVIGINPTGTITFKDGSTVIDTVTLNNRQAVLTQTFNVDGPHQITADYSGDATNPAGTSSAFTVNVGLSGTTTTLSVNPTAMRVGEPVVATITVTGSTPTGQVCVQYDHATSLGCSTLVNGQATINTTNASSTLGMHTLTATYNGDAANISSVSYDMRYEVVDVTVTADTDVAEVGATVVTLTAHVSGASRGLVRFKDGSTVIRSGALINGRAHVSYTFNTVGSHQITADYGGVVTQSPFTVNVVKQTSTTYVQVSPDPVQPGQPLSVTATISADNPTGAVCFTYDEGIADCAYQPTGGTVIVTTTAGAVGTHTVKVSFVGDANTEGSEATVSYTVANNAPPTVSIATSANGANYISPASIALTVNAADADGSIASVELYDGATLLTTLTQAPYTFTWDNAPAGSHALSAKATDNLGSVTTSDTVNISVITNLAPTVSATATPNNAAAPATVTLNATAADADGTIAQVDFFNGATLLATVTDAPYAYSWNNVTQGSYTITARATDNAGATTVSDAVTVTVTGGAGTAYYIYADHLKTPRLITDGSNNVVWEWSNDDPFGSNAPTAANGFEFNMRFAGQYFDKETNLHYNTFRTYDPQTGRYIESDPIGLGGGINTYAYVGGNPVTGFDAFGLANGAEPNRMVSQYGIPATAGQRTTAAALAFTGLGYAITAMMGPEAFVPYAFLMDMQAASDGVPGGRGAGSAEAGVCTANGARGLSNHGGSFSSSINTAGGEVWTATGKISQNDFATYVNSGLYKGDVNIISGVHGTPSGTTIADLSLFKADAARFGNMPGVNVYNFTEMTSQQLTNLLRGPGTTIGGFCDSGACLAPFK